MFNEEKEENIMFLIFLSPDFPLATPKVFKRRDSCYLFRGSGQAPSFNLQSIMCKYMSICKYFMEKKMEIFFLWSFYTTIFTFRAP